MPMAAILSSAPTPRSGRRTQTPMRSSRRSPRTSKRGQRADDPFLDGGDEAAHVRSAALEVEHDVADPLAGAVIGELAAAAGGMHWKARLDQLVRPCRAAGGVKGRVLEQPDQLRRFALRDRCRARRHARERALVIDGGLAHQPLDRRRAGSRRQANLQIIARVNHLITGFVIKLSIFNNMNKPIWLTAIRLATRCSLFVRQKPKGGF